MLYVVFKGDTFEMSVVACVYFSGSVYRINHNLVCYKTFGRNLVG